MGFIKVIKNKAYFKRYQTKFRRRREGKTDYRQRRRLVLQDKNKYLTPKYRFVVRFTNKQVICQVVSTGLKGDLVLSSAYSAELPRYGLTVGLKNYPAAYCTGLLAARRTLAKIGLDSIYKGNEEVDGKVVKCRVENDAGRKKTFWVSEVDEERRPFRCYLDVGLAATTTGARVFGALKGASDGGLDIPHNAKRFPQAGDDPAAFHRGRIFGEHVEEWMEKLSEEDPEKFKAQFSRYIEAGVGAEDLEDLYSKVHAAIRADPSPAPKAEGVVYDKTYQRKAKSNLKSRKNRIRQKKNWRMAVLSRRMAAAVADSGSDSGSDSE